MTEGLDYTATILDREGWVLVDDLMLPASFTVRVHLEGEPWVADLEARVNDAKQVEPVALRVSLADGGPLTAQALRRARLTDVVQAASQTVTRKVELQGSGGRPELVSVPTREDAERGGRITRRTPARRRRERDLEHIAAIVRANPKTPTKAVMDDQGVSRSQAFRLIRKAQKLAAAEED